MGVEAQLWSAPLAGPALTADRSPVEDDEVARGDRRDVDADGLTALMAGGDQLGVLTDALTELNPELGER